MFIYECLLLARIRPLLTTTYGSINSGARLGRFTAQFLANIWTLAAGCSDRFLRNSRDFSTASACPPCPVGYTRISTVFELVG